MAKTDLGGVWRTVGGRRVFIKDGVDLETAMKESGKFKNSEIKSKEKNENENDKKEKRIYDMNNKELDKELEKIKEYQHEISQKEIKIEDENWDQWLKYRDELEKSGKYISMQDRSEYFRQNFSEYKKLTDDMDNSFKKRDEIYKIKENKRYAQNYKKIEKILENTKFYSSEIEQQIADLDYGNRNTMTKVSMLIELDKIAKENKFEISQSPYSFSTYALKKGEKITWGSKPVGSYRISDHWNFESRGEKHCQLTGVNEYTQKYILARYNGKTYDIIKEFDEDDKRNR